MKKLMLLLVAVTGFTATTIAQQVNVSINIGKQPVWGPVGYDYVDYYYLPDIETYYYVPDRVYIYRYGNDWRRSAVLPSRYSDFDVYHAHKVVINGVNKPYLYHDKYHKEYYGYRNKHDQVSIRDSKDKKYFVNKSHPQHKQWKNDNRGRGKQGKGHDKH